MAFYRILFVSSTLIKRQIVSGFLCDISGRKNEHDQNIFIFSKRFNFWKNKCYFKLLVNKLFFQMFTDMFPISENMFVFRCSNIPKSHSFSNKPWTNDFRSHQSLNYAFQRFFLSSCLLSNLCRKIMFPLRKGISSFCFIQFVWLLHFFVDFFGMKSQVKLCGLEGPQSMTRSYTLCDVSRLVSLGVCFLFFLFFWITHLILRNMQALRSLLFYGHNV